MSHEGMSRALATLQAVRAQLGGGTKRTRESTQSSHRKIKTKSALTFGEPLVYWRSGEKDRREGRQEERSADSIMGQIIWQESKGKGKGQHRRQGKVWS